MLPNYHYYMQAHHHTNANTYLYRLDSIKFMLY